MSGRAPLKVAVLMGGPSAEREVSLASGKGCSEALRGEGFDVVDVDAGRDLAARLDEIKPDVVFNALHGRWGEDGCVQGLLTSSAPRMCTVPPDCPLSTAAWPAARRSPRAT